MEVQQRDVPVCAVEQLEWPQVVDVLDHVEGQLKWSHVVDVLDRVEG